MTVPSGAAANAAGKSLTAAGEHHKASHSRDTTWSAQTDSMSEAQLPGHFYQAQNAIAVRLHRHEVAVAKATSAKPAAKPPVKPSSASTATGQSAPARQQAPTAQATPAASRQAAPAPSGSPQQIAEQMLGGYGWSASQFSCLQPLWEHESGWNPYAQNPSSGAYGIPQALPGSQMASAGADWQTNAATQIRWGLNYIKDRYGSPCGAWAHEQAVGWY